jgi:hypothetical protein
MKAYQNELGHAYDSWRSRFRSASLFDSLTIAPVFGVLVASAGIALFVAQSANSVAHSSRYRGVGQVVIVSFLLMIVLEQRRK